MNFWAHLLRKNLPKTSSRLQNWAHFTSHLYSFNYILNRRYRLIELADFIFYRYTHTMQFRSTQSEKVPVPFKDAVLHPLPLDGGLYVPCSTLDVRQFFLYMNADTSYPELVSAVAPLLLQGELNPFSASRVAESAFDFEPELQQLDDQISLLKLYHGYTGTFKDFGITFLAAVMEELLKNSGRALVLSATCGDTGASIAKAFSNRRDIITVMLYPEGFIHGLDPAAFVPNGGTVLPIQIKGTFDDCQRLVMGVLRDKHFIDRHLVTTANAINVGRLLPQSFYYLYAFIKAKKYLKSDLIFSVPSGNFGNLIAGLYAWRLGMPVNGFIAAMNKNNAFGDFINGKKFTPHPLVLTTSPALDVSFPSNYERLASFYEESPAVMRNMVFPAAIDDSETLATMEYVWKKHGVLLDPHTAVAFAAATDYLQSRDTHTHGTHVVILATGHPAKEANIVYKATGQQPALTDQLALLSNKTEPVAYIAPHIDALEAAIMSCF